MEAAVIIPEKSPFQQWADASERCVKPQRSESFQTWLITLNDRETLDYGWLTSSTADLSSEERYHARQEFNRAEDDRYIAAHDALDTRSDEQKEAQRDAAEAERLVWRAAPDSEKYYANSTDHEDYVTHCEQAFSTTEAELSVLLNSETDAKRKPLVIFAHIVKTEIAMEDARREARIGDYVPRWRVGHVPKAAALDGKYNALAKALATLPKIIDTPDSDVASKSVPSTIDEPTKPQQLMTASQASETVLPTASSDQFVLKPSRLSQLIERHPVLKTPVIHKLLRRGETMNLIAAPKIGKSWLATDLAIALASERSWLNNFATERCRVLLIDNELHEETLAQRIPLVASARGIALEEYDEFLSVASLRGNLVDLERLLAALVKLPRGFFGVIILDAMYRFLPKGMDENDNGGMANLYNCIDRVASQLDCAFVLVHHTSKGSQGGKSVTDVGAGAGSQSRAADTHCVLRPHEDNKVIVLDYSARSWEPSRPVCLRWQFPVFNLDVDLDPLLLKLDRPRKQKTEKMKWTTDRFVEKVLTEIPRHKSAIIDDAIDLGISQREASRLLRAAGEQSKAFERRGDMYANCPEPVVTTPLPVTERKRNKITETIRANPGKTSAQIAQLCECSKEYVRQIIHEMKNE